MRRAEIFIVFISF